ncbi:hypothetical protein M422DRAFT_56865 [Sphaerobolus stellatus SS14]|uniref:Uncharacterized protein n=1 Tax=Sphaerobolus stellatus (strain SS14) TaxID=990650 RepID=A0A0C9U2Q0_SPHS4|nr:hypothetical protein M422DRAFT_56865 [Sphaerobolus stellatus SS14]
MRIKQKLVHELNLGKPPRTIFDLQQIGVKVIQRSRTTESPIPNTYYLVDAGNEELRQDHKKTHIVSSRHREWCTVEENESVIFLNEQGEIELAILRGICGRQDVVDYITGIIQEAAFTRRNVRPHHVGKVIQYGYNAGQWHSRIWGLVNNLKQSKLTPDEKAKFDSRMLNLFAVGWSLVKSQAPAEAVKPVLEAIANAGLPEMAAEGFQGKETLYQKVLLNASSSDTTGYSLELEETNVRFSLAERAPCEGYIAVNYAARCHMDKIYAPYAFSWQTHYKPPDGFEGNPGGNYVDLTLAVTIRSSKDSLMVFKPNYPHGTTLFKPGTERAGCI